MRYNITTIEDIDAIQNAILNNEKVELGEIRSIHYKLKLSGGRFANYDPRFIDKFVAKVIIEQQDSYDKMLKEIEKQFSVTIAPEMKQLKFELERGSLELLTNLIGLTEVFDKMESIHQLYAVLGIAGGWFTYKGFKDYMDNKKLQITSKSEEKLQELRGEERADYLHTVDGAIEALSSIANNVILQKAINAPKQALASQLQDDETLTINDDVSHPISKTSVPRYEFVQPTVDDIEEEVEGLYTISHYHFTCPNKSFKLDGIGTLANSLPMSAQKRIQIISKAEKLESVRLKLKLIKDGLTQKIKQVFILDYLQD